MKPLITTKIIKDNGDIHTLELFSYKSAFVLHKHLITSDDKKAELFQKMRKFWGKWYCKQEIVISKEEYRAIVGFYESKKCKTYKNN